MNKYLENGKRNSILPGKSVLEGIQRGTSDIGVNPYIKISDVHSSQALLAKNLALKEFVVGGHNRGEVQSYIKSDFDQERGSGEIEKLRQFENKNHWGIQCI